MFLKVPAFHPQNGLKPLYYLQVELKISNLTNAGEENDL
jgi:hypothetical protein